MLTWLVSTSLQFRVVVLALAVLLLVGGVRTAGKAPLDVFPEFAQPLIEIQTEAPGLSAEEVEGVVTVPLENALNGTGGLTTIRSKSVLGLSSVVMLFEPDADMTAARQMVSERVAAETARLGLARPPVVLPPLSSMSRVLKVGLSSKTLNQQDLTVLTMWTIRPKLMAVPGVANVAVWGQRDKQLQVKVDPERLRANGVTLDAVVRAATDATAQDAGGWVETPTQRMTVRHVSPVKTPEDLARMVVAPAPPAGGSGGAAAPALRIGDVADVVTGSPPPIGDAIINDGPGILLIVEKQPTGNTLEVTRGVEAALAALKPGLTGVEVDSTIFRPATFIERALGNLTHALVLGCVLVMVILLLFLFDWRTAVISMTAIPLSLVAAALVLYWRGGTINTMVLAGLVIALGEVVDDAIIDVENIVRRLRLNLLSPNPEPAFAVVLKASLEVRSAVVYASLIVVLVFLPIFFLDGVAGSFFRPLALAYVLAILASLLVALTVTPALSLLLIRAKPRAHEAPLARALKAGYRRVLPWLVARPAAAVGTLVLAFGLTILAATRLGEEFLPDFQETDFLMHWVLKPGASVEASNRITIQASKELRAIPGVRDSFGSHVGRAEVADEVVGPNFTELWISIDPSADHKATVAKIQAAVDGYPGLYRDVLTYLKERIKEVLTGASGSIVVRIYGPELPVLRDKAKDVEKAMAGVAGVTNLKVESQVLVPQIDVQLKPAAAEAFGLTAGQVRRQVTTLVKGTKVGDVFQDQKRFAVVVTGVDALRTDVSSLRRVMIETPGGAHVPLGDVAEVAVVSAPNEVKREGASRRIDVTCNAAGRDLGTVAREIEAAVRALPFPREYHPEFLGEYQARAASSRRLYTLAAVALAGIFLLLYVDFQSVRLSLLVFLTLPFALVGGVFAAFVSGGVLSLGSLVGFVTVLGIAARNGIMLVSHYRHLREVEGEPFGLALVLRGAEERLAPILMTALATGLALVPLVVDGNKPGQEIEYPLAVVILGGLVTSTLLNLFLLPPLYVLWGRGLEAGHGVNRPSRVGAPTVAERHRVVTPPA